MFSYCLSEPEAGSDAAAMTTRAERTGDGWVLNGVKRWITNAGVSEFYTVFAVTEPGARSRGISAFVVSKSDAGVSFGAPEKKLGIKGSPTREVYFDNVHIPDVAAYRRAGHRVRDRDAHARPHPGDHRRAGRRDRAGRARLRPGYVKERHQFGQAVADFQGVQFMLADMGMKLTAARELTYAAAGRPSAATPT